MPGTRVATMRSSSAGFRQRDVQVQAAALQRVAQVADVVGGQEHQRRGLGDDHAQLRHRDLVGRQHLQQEGLEGLVGLVDLVDQQDAAVVLAQRLHQRARLQEGLGEEQVAHAVQAVHGRVHVRRVGQRRAHPVLEDLGVEQLLAVLPLVERLGLVQALVALHADQRLGEQAGGGERQLGLADAGRALDQDRLLQVHGHVEGGGDAARGDVADAAQALDQGVDGGERVGGRRAGGRGGSGNRQSLRLSKWSAANPRSRSNAPIVPSGRHEGKREPRRPAGARRSR